MDPRQQRGLQLAALARIVRKGSAWIVPSQTGDGSKYTVCPDAANPHCTCKDHELTGKPCKHIFAVEYVIKRESDVDGNAVQTTTITVTETIKKPTYRQDWSNYNAAQVNEKDKFQSLLHDLCRGIQTPPYKGGRPCIPLSDAVFAACFKVYSTVSGRRFMSDLREAQWRGHVAEVAHYNSIFRCLESAALTPLLKTLVVETSLPLKAIEVDFACDSSGFAGSRFVKWFDFKHGKERKWHRWVKAHCMVGVKTNCVTSAEVSPTDGADSPYMPDHVRQTAQNFKIRDVCGDKGYSTVENHEVVAEVGGTPFIAFKSVATGFSGGLWEKCFHYFSFKREEFLRHYHKRSNAESTFSMMKAKFRDHVRSKGDTAMVNEVYCKIICHNICCLISAMYELNIEPTFWGSGPCPKTEPTALKLLANDGF